MKDRSLARLFLTLVLSISLVFSLTFTSVAYTDSASTDCVDVIVTFKQSPGPSDQNAFQALGGQVEHSFSVIPAFAGRVPVQALDGLRKNPRVNSIELDRVVQALEYVAAEELLNSWGVNKIGAGLVHSDGIAG